jgi:hypothetical protein
MVVEGIIYWNRHFQICGIESELIFNPFEGELYDWYKIKSKRW